MPSSNRAIKSSLDILSMVGLLALSFLVLAAAAHSNVIATGPSSTSVTCDPSSLPVGEGTTCTATVSGQSPTGMITWASSSYGSFSGSPCTLSMGSCSVTYSQGSEGTPVITASYQGDAFNGPSSGNATVNFSSTGVSSTTTITSRTTISATSSATGQTTSTSTTTTYQGTGPTGPHTTFTCPLPIATGGTCVATGSGYPPKGTNSTSTTSGTTSGTAGPNFTWWLIGGAAAAGVAVGVISYAKKKKK